LLAGLLAGAFALADSFVAYIHADGENFVVVGAGFFEHAVVGREADWSLGELLNRLLGSIQVPVSRIFGQARNDVLVMNALAAS
jgi:hypothetical protein